MDNFNKVIAALCGITKYAKSEEIKKNANIYLDNMLESYKNYLLNNDINSICFKNSEKEIVDFANECYEDETILDFAENLEYGYSELVDFILKRRKK